MKLFNILKKDAGSSKSELRDYLFKEIKKAMESWEEKDIYAVSLLVQNNYDNPCEPMVILGYNTEKNFKSQIKNAYDEAEARWNYAFWLQNNKYSFGLEDTQIIVKNWIVSKGYHYYSYEEMFSADREISPKTYEGTTEAFVQELIMIVKELHESGFIKYKFEKDVPILIHELEYYDKIAKQNLEANPPHIIEEFISFCLGG